MRPNGDISPPMVHLKCQKLTIFRPPGEDLPTLRNAAIFEQTEPKERQDMTTNAPSIGVLETRRPRYKKAPHKLLGASFFTFWRLKDT